MSFSTISQTALSGIRASEAMLGVAADNLANAQTAGFKQSQVQLATRPSVGPVGAQVGSGVQVVGVASDTSQGALLPGSGPLNLAISGDGYFVLEGSDGQQLFTRDGQFHANAEGQLVSEDGNRVLGVQGEPNIFQDEMTPLFILSPRQQAEAPDAASGAGGNQYQFGADGSIRDASSRTIGQIRLAQFNNRLGLRAVDGNRFQATASSGPAQIGNPGAGGRGHLAFGSNEASNTDIAGNLIGVSRAELLFRANLEVLSVADELSEELLDMLRR